MYCTFGVFAHVDAGKTTLSEQVLYKCSVIRSLGRVDHKNSFMDNTDVERKRGITVFSQQAGLSYGGVDFFLVDTPGHIDFSPEMERALSAIDIAVVVISAPAGIQAQTEKIWKLTRKYSVPVVFFINKIDQPGADWEQVVASIQKKFSQDAVLCDGKINDEVVEKSVIISEEMLDKYIDGSITEDEKLESYRIAFSKRLVYPIITGSAIKGGGVDTLLDQLCILAYKNYDAEGKLSALAYKVRYDNRGTRLTFLKILSGTLKVKDVLGEEKVDQLYMCSGGKMTSIETASAGQLVAAVGLSVKSGKIIGQDQRDIAADTVAVMMSTVCFDGNVGVRKVLDCLRRLEDEQPELNVGFNTASGEITISVLGDIQLEVLKEQMAERFGIDVWFSNSRIMYKETISGSVIGYGHFEPLRHYAEVHLELSELPRGSGIEFESKCSTDFLAKNWQNLIKTHVFEKTHVGDLTGSPLTDIKIKLLNGRAHEKHTEGGDFREATYRAIRQGVFKGNTILLEPQYDFEIEVDNSISGRIISDIRKMSGETLPPETTGEKSIVRGKCPVSELNGYMRELMSFTKGRAIASYTFGGYRECHNPSQVIEDIGYERERDVENTADSVFCSHGAGFNVKWSQVEEYIHLS